VTAKRIENQERHDKNKVYSVHEPLVECIRKGKAHKRYEFGCKVSVASATRGGWFVGAMVLHGNPYDGHTLEDARLQVEHVAANPTHAFVDVGYRGHGYEGPARVHVDKRRRGKTARSLWRWVKHRSVIEPSIGQLKREHRMDRNRLEGTCGDRINAIPSAAGMNFWKLQRFAAAYLRRLSLPLLLYQKALAY
jgi:IS5 family transposase